MISATPRRRPSQRALCAVAGGSVHLRAKMRVRNRFWHELFRAANARRTARIVRRR
jgi:hypothetical protein